jgi:hypothetical protein
MATFALLVLVCVTQFAAQDASSQRTYPNELSGLRFYAKHLSPLRPYVSDKAAVVQVLGSDQGKTIDGWRLWPLFVGDAGPAKGHLAAVTVIPEKRVSMRDVRFPVAFAHGWGSVSETNVTCDVYADNDGLEYWLYAEDSAVAKKGDLMHIVYGPSKLQLELRRQPSVRQ